MNFKSIKFKLISLTAVCLLLGALIIIYLLNGSYKNNVKLISEEAVKTSQAAYNNLEKSDINMISSTMQALLVDRDVKEAFVKRDREVIAKVAKPLFEELKKRYKITHWYFHLPEPESKVLYRVHKPDQSGDVVTRTTYKESVRTKDFAGGKELGKTAAFALRIVHPYYDGDKLIGYIELGEEIDHFLPALKQQTGDDYTVLIDKKFVKEQDWADMIKAKGVRNNWSDYKDFLLIESTEKEGSKQDASITDEIAELKGSAANVPNNGMVLEQEKNGDKMLVSGAFPIYDAAKNKVGVVFVHHDITKIYNDLQKTQRNIILSIIALMVIIFVSMVAIINKLIVKRLNNAIEVTTRVVGGDFNSSILISAEDEIGQIEGLIEQFRGVFVNVLGELESKDDAKSQTAATSETEE